MIDNKLMACCYDCDNFHAVSYSFCRYVDGKTQMGKVVTCSHMPVCYKAKEEEKNNAIKPGDKVTLTGTVEGVKDVQLPFWTNTREEATIEVKNENGIESVTVWSDLLKKENEEE